MVERYAESRVDQVWRLRDAGEIQRLVTVEVQANEGRTRDIDYPKEERFLFPNMRHVRDYVILVV